MLIGARNYREIASHAADIPKHLLKKPGAEWEGPGAPGNSRRTSRAAPNRFPACSPGRLHPGTTPAGNSVQSCSDPPSGDNAERVPSLFRKTPGSNLAHVTMFAIAFTRAAGRVYPCLRIRAAAS
jgi:hypothetical protein